MQIKEYLRDLSILVQQKYVGRYLAPGSKEALLECIQRAERSLHVKRGKILGKWELHVQREHPVRFCENGDRFQVDLAGTIKGEEEKATEVSTLLRIWSLNPNLCYRPGIDGDQSRDRWDSAGRRVMVRYHFDRRAPGVKIPEPVYHLQTGGNGLSEENCWFPKEIDVPRFHFPPMDIVLLCELVLLNFFHEQSEDLRKTPEWRSLVRKSQDAFQADYVKTLGRFFDDTKNTLLGHLVSNIKLD